MNLGTWMTRDPLKPGDRFSALEAVGVQKKSNAKATGFRELREAPGEGLEQGERTLKADLAGDECL